MPYITPQRRYEVDPHIELRACGARCNSAGELVYALTDVCLGYLRSMPNQYCNMNTVMGALASTAQEFYRRVVVPYEQEKCDTNGDVY